MSHPLWYTLLMIMNDIQLNENGAIVDGTQHDTHCFNYAGHEVLTIPALDLISYDDGDSWEDMH
jgi:hypothetical protein